MNISVKFGTFNVVENKENNGISIYNGDNKVLDIANINWWDKDAIENAMYAKESLIKERNKNYRDVKIESLNKAIDAMEKIYENEIKKWKDRYRVLAESKNNISINDENVVEVLETANNVLKNISDKKDRGFVCSRVSQVINRLHSVTSNVKTI